jgi:hypothetical protein
VAAPALRSTPDDRSLSELLGDLSNGTAQLIRKEVQLARTETAESSHALRGGAVRMAVALVSSICALGALTAGAILSLSQYVFDGRTWLAALVVAVVLGLIAVVFAKSGAHALSASALRPDETTTSIKETAAWLKHPTKSAGSSR